MVKCHIKLYFLACYLLPFSGWRSRWCLFKRSQVIDSLCKQLALQGMESKSSKDYQYICNRQIFYLESSRVMKKMRIFANYLCGEKIGTGRLYFKCSRDQSWSRLESPVWNIWLVLILWLMSATMYLQYSSCWWFWYLQIGRCPFNGRSVY